MFSRANRNKDKKTLVADIKQGTNRQKWSQYCEVNRSKATWEKRTATARYQPSALR